MRNEDIHPAQVTRFEVKTPPASLYLPKRKPWTEKLTRNAAIASAILLTLAVIQGAAGGDTAVQAVQGAIESQWDESVGKLTFVSALLPEAEEVFFGHGAATELTAPCVGSAGHEWTEEEPYHGFTAASVIYACAQGEVMSVGHGEDEEFILRIRHPGDLESVYYNLSACFVTEGDSVTAQTCVGLPMEGRQACVSFERSGLPFDPGKELRAREEP